MYQYIFKQSSVKCHNLVRTEQRRDQYSRPTVDLTHTPFTQLAMQQD